MSGSAPTNNQAVAFEQQQAAQAAAQEAQRQEMMKQGTAAINAIFDPSPAVPASSTQYDWGSFKPAQPVNPQAAAWAAQNKQAAPAGTPAQGVPAGYSAVQVPVPAAAGGSRYAGTPFAGLGPDVQARAAGGGGGGTTWALKDQSGKVYRQGDPLTINTPAKAAGGFGPDFYDAYKQKILDFYLPDEQRQYQQAQRDLTYGLARSGNLTSSVAADKQGELAYQDALQKANYVAQANKQTGDLQNQIAANKQAMINELYSTGDPTQAASMAAESAKASQLATPTLTPAAALFSPALTAVGAAGGSYLSPYQPGAVGGAGYGAGAGTGATVANAGAGTGRVITG